MLTIDNYENNIIIYIYIIMLCYITISKLNFSNNF